MNRFDFLRRVTLAAVLALTPAVAANAQSQNPVMSRLLDSFGRPAQTQSGQALPLRVLIALVQQQRGGQFQDVVGGLQERGGRAFYVFRWRYPSGVEENIMVDAATGQVLG